MGGGRGGACHRPWSVSSEKEEAAKAFGTYRLSIARQFGRVPSIRQIQYNGKRKKGDKCE